MSQSTTSVSVNPTPTAVPTNDGYICNGGTVNLSANPTAGTGVITYAWVGSNIVTGASSSSATATPTATGINVYTLTVTDGSSQSGCVSQATTTVSVSPMPAAAPSSDGPICVGGTVNLTANETNATMFAWFGSNITSATNADVATATPTGTSVYTITVSDGSTQSGCVNSYTTTVVVNGSPSLSTASNDGPVCAGVTLDFMANGPVNVTDYSWTGPNTFTSTQQNPSIIGTTIAATGIYTVTVNNGVGSGCSNTYTTAATVNPLPVVYNVSGSGTICASDSGIHVILSGSDIGITYQLYNGTLLGSLAGSGNPLDFGLQHTSGTYTVLATDNTTGCSDNMSGAGVIVVNPLPTQYTVLGAGTNYCAGGAGIAVSLSGSDTAINYQLYLGSYAVVGGLVSGTGSAFSFGSQTAEGDYIVVATDSHTGCTNVMTGVAAILVDPLPTVYTVSAGGAYCAGSTGVDITLSGSDTGISYHLFNSATLGTTLRAGTGSVLDFGPQTAGSITVFATNNITTCTTTMSGNPVVSVNPLPAVDTVSGGGTYCQGTGGMPVLINASSVGINYRLYNGTTYISTTPGTGIGFNFGPLTASGTYTVNAVDAVTGCSSNMYGNAVIIMNAAPTVYSMTGGANYCAGTGGSTIGLSGSQTGISYTLNNLGGSVSTIAGTGSSFNFTGSYPAGTYSVIATNTGTFCTSNMSGVRVVVMNALPVVDTVTGGGSYCSGSGGVAVGLNTSTTGIRYDLYHSTSVPAIASVYGLGSSLSFGPITAPGTYTVSAVDTATGCSSQMADSAMVVVVLPVTPAVTVTTGVGDTVCAGSMITFTANPVNGGGAPLYHWSVNASVIAGVSTGSYSYVPANGDVVKAVLISNAACASPDSASAADTMTVETQVTPAVNISVNPGTSVCLGTNVTFSAMPTYGGTLPAYNWYKNGILATTGSSYSYMPSNNDNVSVLLTSNFSCVTADTTSSHVVMKVGAEIAPVVEIIANPGTEIVVGQVDTLTAYVANANGQVSYQWVVDSAVIAGATTSVYHSTFNNNDSVTCQVINNNGCDLAGFNSVKIHVFPVGIKAVTFGSGDVRLVPNPNKGDFAIKGTISTLSDEEITMEVTDMIGQVIYTNKVIVHNGIIDTHIQLSNTLANGMYMMNLRSGSDSKVFHFVIEQ